MLIVLPPDAVTITDHHNGTTTVACRAAPWLVYNLESSPDLTEWTHVEALTADSAGHCEKIVGIAGTHFYRFTYQPPP